MKLISFFIQAEMVIWTHCVPRHWKRWKTRFEYYSNQCFLSLTFPTVNQLVLASPCKVIFNL